MYYAHIAQTPPLYTTLTRTSLIHVRTSLFHALTASPSQQPVSPTSRNKFRNSNFSDKASHPSKQECKSSSHPPRTRDKLKPGEPSCPVCQTGTQKIVPFFQESNKPHMMKDCSKRLIPPERVPPPKRTYTSLIALGMVALLSGLYALYYFDESNKKQPSPVTVAPARRKLTKKERIPATSAEIPNEVPYLLIGGGTASFSASKAIRESDPKAKILIVSYEPHFPYVRTPLSKELWLNNDPESRHKLMYQQSNGTEKSLFFEEDDYFVGCKELSSLDDGGIAVARGWEIIKIDIYEKRAYLEDNKVIHYDKCLVATGATPKSLPVFDAHKNITKEKVMTYRGIGDFEHLEDLISNGIKSVVIVGGNFLGSELACALARKTREKGLKVHQIVREHGNMGKVLPKYLSRWTTEKVRKEGVNVILNSEVEAVAIDHESLVLTLNSGNKINADQVVLTLGVTPNTKLAGPSQLELDSWQGGFLVNAEMMARSCLWIAGDCTCFYDVKLGRRHVEHHDHAVVSGTLAGENMVGGRKPYWHQSMFWSDLGPGLSFEAIGMVDADLPTVGIFEKVTDKDKPKAVFTVTEEGNHANNKVTASPTTQTPLSKPREEADSFGKGVIFYLKDEVIVGIVLWNVFKKINVAREVLKGDKKYRNLSEVAKLFNIHDEEVNHKKS
uniref:Apoptosis-inducing factor 1, mitochondrial n=1 Tax=Timema poppense TaxID=170557 RepID=A0A7R9DAG1_TIMPO|nr:unnamed protein product [Timema poppensis]